jgi:peptidyl-prolyl cis-trans isomerase D
METIVEREKVLEAEFRTPVNTESELIEVDGGYFIVKTEGITAPAPKPIDLVRPEVVKMWERQTRLAEATKIAEKAAADIGSGSFAAAADADKRLSYAQLGPVTRFGESLQRDYIIDSKRVGPDLLERLFKAKVGDVVTAPVLNGHVIARLKEIVPAKAEGELATAPAQLSASVKNTVSQDLLLQFTRALSERYPVTVNKEVVDQLTASRY